MSRSPGTDAGDVEKGLLSMNNTENLRHISYSREETIEAFRDYYDFLSQMYLEPESIITPPAEGWPEIPVEKMRELGKTDEVAELLRHVPYVRQARDGGNVTQCIAGCDFADWTEFSRTEEPPLLLTEFPWPTVPADVIGISRSNDFQIFLDMLLGVIYYPDAPEFVGASVDGDEPRKPIRDNADEYAPRFRTWRGTHAWAIPDFFEVTKYHFRVLNFVPFGSRIVEFACVHEGEADPDLAGACEMVQGIFREHGWPSMEHYQKAKCIKAVDDAIQAGYASMFFSQ